MIIGALVWIDVLTVRIRRLHDTDRRGWWVLLVLLPFVGNICLFILMLLPTKRNSRWR
ncbi:hypothetical protein FC83_GL002683 [Agrilactobacillus composti DSM 18527 = JCM 14202]|uniref:Cardiolipin synthase N-terminal domain-containing protein n=2 Tax=Agrilactobacillus TaxID=2767875 RepID=X0QTT0_9LACO|nr:hypothetical protein FC83_GL002683 [Agrilactobacillus composti DSM 18527 = JCM 14202]GAF41980.1 integral membrane protein [Agrilactobacillus composti DSM 18527 = JCM 14202]